MRIQNPVKHLRWNILNVWQGSENTSDVHDRIRSSCPKASNFIKKETLAQVFSSEFSEISKNTFFQRTPPVAASVECNFYGNCWKIAIFVKLIGMFKVIEMFIQNFYQIYNCRSIFGILRWRFFTKIVHGLTIIHVWKGSH